VTELGIEQVHKAAAKRFRSADIRLVEAGGHDVGSAAEQQTGVDAVNNRDVRAQIAQLAPCLAGLPLGA